MCKNSSHSTSYCRIVKEAKRILNRQTPALRTYFAELSADPHNPELSPLADALTTVVEELGDNIDPQNTIETLYGLELFWNTSEGELSEEESDDSPEHE